MVECTALKSPQPVSMISIMVSSVTSSGMFSSSRVLSIVRQNAIRCVAPSRSSWSRVVRRSSMVISMVLLYSCCHRHQAIQRIISFYEISLDATGQCGIIRIGRSRRCRSRKIKEPTQGFHREILTCGNLGAGRSDCHATFRTGSGST